MRIVAVNVYRVELPGGEARHISGGRVFSGQDSTVVELRTDEAQVGWGESCPFGPSRGHAMNIVTAQGQRRLSRKSDPLCIQ